MSTVQHEANKRALKENGQGHAPMSERLTGPVMATLVQWRALRARVAQLEDINQILEAGAEKAFGMAKGLCAERDEARARVTKLEAALKPFADESLWAGPQHEFVTVKLSDCDQARAALKDAPQ